MTTPLDSQTYVTGDSGPGADVLEHRRANARAARDALLRASDWTQLPDSPLTALQQSAWATYRHALRNLPADPAWPDCDWPAEPSLPVGTASI